MIRQHLHHGWQLTATSTCTDWRYTNTFATSAPDRCERVDLVFDGLDTMAAIELNGRMLGQAANRHRGYRFDIRDLLTHGGNNLTVSFTGLDRGATPPAAVSWRPVRLERWHIARLARVRPVVTVSGDGTGLVELHADIEWADRRHQDLELRISVGAVARTVLVPAGAKTVIAPIHVPAADLWWPVGHGAQPLYDLSAGLWAKPAGERLDGVVKRIGFHTITVDAAPDEIETPFPVVVNGKRISVKGADWIPGDHGRSLLTRDRLARRVGQAIAAGSTLLRIRSGGIYESDDFYDLCDERGVLVWQDFPFPSAAHPRWQPSCAELAAGARENVARLMPHASLAIWNGGHENPGDFAGRARSPDQSGISGYFTELLPGIVADLDPGRRYCPGGPRVPLD